MSYLALYRKYRPCSFDDFVGQSEVASIIKNEILNDKISHAYLFSGPRGTGKTSTAKIIARMINCNNLALDGIPCGQCESCLNFNNNSDIVEIDAASNNGVDEIRELRDKVNLVPTLGKYKIYIIDEVHMLTTQAFNALLKTLEEPPSHVIFILATTEFYKIPVTVVSRCQKFQFVKFSINDICLKLRQIADNESINVNDDVLCEIARLSDGGLRDAINMLDQLSSFKSGELLVEDVYKLNGVISFSEFKMFLTFIHDNDIVSIVEFLENIDRYGKSFERFIEELILFLKDVLVFKNTANFNYDFISEKIDGIRVVSDLYSDIEIYNLIILLNDVSIRIKSSSFTKILLISEMIRFSRGLNIIAGDVTSEDLSNSTNVNHTKSSHNKEFEQKVNLDVPDGDGVVFKGITDKVKKIRINNTFATASKVYKENFMKKWFCVLDVASKKSDYVSIAGMMNDVEILVVGEKNVIFLAQYASLLERLLLRIDLIEKLLLEIFNINYKVVFLLSDEWDFEKEKYINNLKSSKKYFYIDEDDTGCSFSNKVDEDVDKIVSILGDDIIVYK